MKSFKISFLLLLLLTLLVQTSCEKKFEYEASPRPQGKFNGSILDYLKSRPDVFSLLVQGVEKAGMSGTLNSDTYTLFAPDDIAFKAFLGTRRISDLSNTEIKNIILLHLINRKILSSDLTLDIVPYASQFPGKNLNLSRNVEFVITVNGNRVFLSNVEPNNGAVHVIPSVLR